MTKRNKFFCGVLSALVATQFGFGMRYAVMDGTSPCEFLNHLVVRMLFHRSLVQSLPDINLDVYKMCLPHRWRAGELTFISISVVFGTPLPSNFNIISPLEF